MGKKPVDWLILHNGKALCRRCGQLHPFNELMPLSIGAVNVIIAGYTEEHRDCVQGEVTYPRPVPADGTVEQRAQRWLADGRTGISSETICRFMRRGLGAAVSGAGNWGPRPPQDPSDFGRCRQLLDLIPEWRERMAEMAAVPGWERIAPAWAELDALWDEESKRADDKAPKLYRRIQELVR
jgi:hypothetical protein